MSTSTAPPGRSQRPSARAGGSDAGASEIIGSLLMAGITVGMAVTFGHSMLSAVPDSAGPPPSTLDLELTSGPGDWGDGDETVVLHHVGGAALPTNRTTVRVDAGAGSHVYESSNLTGPFDDGHFAIGEMWNATLSIPASTEVSVAVVREASQAETVATLHARSGAEDCTDDAEPPTVPAWTQDPDDLTAATDGAVTVTATASDACSGVDPDTTPHLRYRFNDTSTFSDAGAMEHLTGTTWRGEIPEPTDGWDARAGDSLVYRLDPLEDLAGNNGTSENVTDLVDAGDTADGTLTYVTDYLVFSGTVTNFPAAQNASDDGDAAVLEENVTSPNATTSEAYGTAYSSGSGAEDPGAATGSPDDGHARLDEDDEWVGVEGFQTFRGDILSVEVALQGHYVGSTSGGADELVLSYRVGTDPGKTSNNYDPSTLNESSDGPTEYLNVTADRDWDWNDVGELQVRATYDRKGSLDDLTYKTDALWVRVTYDNPSYNMSIAGDVLSVPSGDHDLELRYRVSEEPHHVQVWNATGGTWEQRGDALTASTLSSWSTPLTSDDVDAGDVRFRVVDDARDPDQQSTVDLDYARVRTR